MQETKGAGSSENIVQPPAGGVFLDHKPELAVPQGGTSEENTSAGPEDVSHEFENSATEAAGGQDQAVKNMTQPLDTTNPVNVTDGPEERGPREDAAHANTLASTDANTGTEGVSGNKARPPSLVRRHDAEDSSHVHDMPETCTSTCGPHKLKREACRSRTLEASSWERLDCECKTDFFDVWIDCALCHPETYSDQTGQIMGVIMRRINDCQQANMTVDIDMQKIPGYHAPPLGASVSNIPEVTSPVKSVASVSEASQAAPIGTIMQGTALPVVTSSDIEQPPSPVAEAPVSSAEPVGAGHRLENHVAMVLGLVVVVAFIFH